LPFRRGAGKIIAFSPSLYKGLVEKGSYGIRDRGQSRRGQHVRSGGAPGRFRDVGTRVVKNAQRTSGRNRATMPATISVGLTTSTAWCCRRFGALSITWRRNPGGRQSQT
jgi:hypothetical protein